MKEFLKIASAVILPNVGGIVNGQITRQNLQAWYTKLHFPACRPPNWAFAPVWCTLYSSMGYASYLVWRDGGGFGGDARYALSLYGAQLALNWAWTPIFFGQRNIKGGNMLYFKGLIDILMLTATASACGVLFYKINKLAGWIFIPYVSWLTFASVLNYGIYKFNPRDPRKDKYKQYEKLVDDVPDLDKPMTVEVGCGTSTIFAMSKEKENKED